MRVLITGATSALAFRLEKALDSSFNVIFADSEDLPRFLIQNRGFIQIPAGASSSFAHQLLTICLDQEITHVFPLRRTEINALSEARQLFDEYGIRVMVPLQPALASVMTGAKTGELRLIGMDSENKQENSNLDRGAFLVEAGGTASFQMLMID